MNSIKIREEKGQSLILVAFAILTLLAFVGLAVDLGLAYVERIRVRRAADAAALAAAAELPLEDAAHIRALEYLEDNDYGCDLQVTGAAATFFCNDTSTVRLEINGNYISGPAEDNATRTVRLNTVDYRLEPDFVVDTADRIRVEIIEDAPVYFMKLFDFFEVPVKGSATAENINNLDIALIFDRSGSMEFDTLCNGCWTAATGAEYPEGDRHPLFWGSDPNEPDHCKHNGPLVYSGKKYIIIEAEEYGELSNAYQRELRNLGYTYWVLQRNGSQVDTSYMDNAGAYGRDIYGAYIEHLPAYPTSKGGGGVSCTWADLLNIPEPLLCRQDPQISGWGGPFPAPRVDYKFTVPDTGLWYFWIRGQGGNSYTSSYLFWGIDGTPVGKGTASNRSDYHNGARSGRWSWEYLVFGESGSSIYGQTLTAGVEYTLNIWGGSPGFALDRIVITNNSSTSLPGNVQSNAHIDDNRTDWACDPCDARFGGSPDPAPLRPTCTSAMAPQPYRYLDDIYDDEQPIRAAVESAKKFVRRLDPRYDQIGYISYSPTADIKDRLECLRQHPDTCADGYDPDSGLSSDHIEATVIKHLDETHAYAGTNIGHGVMLGTDILSNRFIDGHQNWGRPGAAHIMIVMTDGRTNTLGGMEDICYADDTLWHDNTGSTTEVRARDCLVYYAREALYNGIVIYSITLGETADIELMTYVAELTGGVHQNAPRPEQLDGIFDELYERIFLRLVD